MSNQKVAGYAFTPVNIMLLVRIEIEYPQEFFLQVSTNLLITSECGLAPTSPTGIIANLKILRCGESVVDYFYPIA